MKNFIIPPVGFFFLSVVFGLLFISELAVSGIVDSETKISEGSCTFKSWSVSQGHPIMNLDCNGQKGITGQAEVVIGYVKKPGPLNCSLWKSGSAICKVPE